MQTPPSIFASINRWVFPLAGLLAVGPLAAWPTAALRAPDGALATTPILSDSPVVGVLAGLAALVVAGAWGLVSSLFTSIRYGLFTTGLVLAWVTWSTGTTDLIMRTDQAAAHYWRLPIEGLIFGVVGVLIAGVIAAAGRRPTENAESPAAPVAERIRGGVRATLGMFRREDDEGASIGQRGLVLLAAALVGAVIAWLLAVEALKGQAFGAAVVGALLGATAGEVIASSGKGDPVRAPVPLFFLAATVLAVAGPIAAMAAHAGPSGVAEAATTAGANPLIPIARVLPLDWIAGAFVGVPIGLSWADALVDRAQK